MTRHSISLALCLGFATLAGCQGDGADPPTSDDGPIGCTTPPVYPDNTSPVIGAYLTRVERSLTPERAAAANIPELWNRARNSAAGPDVEHERALLAIDMLARRYLRIWLDAAGVAPADWADRLPTGRQLTPEEVSKATADALVIVTSLREPLAPASWDLQWDATAAAVHEAQLSPIPGLPQEWYGADNAFRAAWIAARVAADGAASLGEAFGRIAAPAAEAQAVSLGFVDELIAVGE